MLKLYVAVQEKIHAFKQDISGATAIEYGLIAAGIGLVVLVAAQTLGGELATLFGTIGDGLSGAP
ncbi:MAG TPA: Flp family type IVb pilin [Alphaproteobacteria bacterium]|nr:Flp family type IVb pilin [Alphaproteobacteria bacterium]